MAHAVADLYTNKSGPAVYSAGPLSLRARCANLAWAISSPATKKGRRGPQQSGLPPRHPDHCLPSRPSKSGNPHSISPFAEWALQHLRAISAGAAFRQRVRFRLPAVPHVRALAQHQSRVKLPILSTSSPVESVRNWRPDQTITSFVPASMPTSSSSGSFSVSL